MGGVNAALPTITPRPTPGADADDQVGDRGAMDIANRDNGRAVGAYELPSSGRAAALCAVPVRAISRYMHDATTRVAGARIAGGCGVAVPVV